MARKSIIKRQNKGRRKTRFRIILDLLLPRHVKLLTQDKLLDEISSDDAALKIIFKMEDQILDNPMFRKVYIDPHTKEITNLVEMNRNLKLVKWDCAYCKIPIESQMDYFKPDNFVCESCNERYVKDAKMVPNLILEDSLAFTHYCKALLRKDQKAFIEYLKKSKK